MKIENGVCLRSAFCILTSAFLLLLLLIPCTPAYAAAPPNIVFLISDDHSSFSLGCYGSNVRTPNLDKLAADGVRFTNAFVASPQCSPSRSAVLTGKSPHRTNTSRLHMPLSADVPTLVDHLESAGYHSGGFKKHHLGPELRKKFDFYSSETDWAAFFDKRPKDKPFFLWVGFTDPHRDYAPGAAQPPHDPADVNVPPFLPDTPEVRADLALYQDHVTRMDGHAGEILALLERHGVVENTLVFFFGDNGMPFPGAKGTLFDPGMRVPLIARWPAGKVTGGRVEAALVSLLDLFPTALSVAGVDVPRGSESINITPLLKGESKNVRKEVFAERNWHDNFDPSRCVRTERFKLIYYCRPEVPHEPIGDLARSPTWQSILALHAAGKLTADMDRRFFHAPRPMFELFDVQADPNETTNLADDAAHAATRQDLEDRLTKWMDSTNDFLASPAVVRRAERLYAPYRKAVAPGATAPAAAATTRTR
jgi:arylsulfatase A-like enzyme